MSSADQTVSEKEQTMAVKIFFWALAWAKNNNPNQLPCELIRTFRAQGIAIIITFVIEYAVPGLCYHMK